jgi:hypothetical protein
MGGQIENDVHVRLVKPEIQARAIKVEEPPEVTFAHEVMQLVDRRVVLEGMAGHKDHAGGRRGIDEYPCLVRGGCHRLFDKYVLPRCDCFQGKRRMARGWRGDDERVNTGQGILDIRVCRDAVLGLATAVTDLSEPLVHADDSGYPSRGTKHADVSGTPETHSNDADPNPPSSRPHVPPPTAAIPQPWSLRSFLPVGSLAYHRLETAPPHERPDLRQIRVIDTKPAV